MSSTAVYLLMTAIAVPLLIVDLVVGGRRTGEMTLRAAISWSALWVTTGLLFGLLVMPHYAAGGGSPTATVDFFTVYLIEKSLSVDNVFLWLLVFSTFSVPRELQRRVLLLGVLGAVVLRTVMVVVAASLFDRLSWLLYVTAVFLLVGAVKLWRERKDHPHDLDDPTLLRWLRRVIPTTEEFHGEKFWVRQNGKLLATPLLLVLVLIELSDVVLALDALPAALSVTTDTTVVLTANIFAVLGLRALFELLARVADRLVHLKAAVAVILAWIALTLIAEHAWGAYPLSTGHSLAVIVTVISLAVIRSLMAKVPDPVDPVEPSESEPPAGGEPTDQPVEDVR